MSFAAVISRLQALENPYPGLRPFDTTESHLFFGRDAQVAELVARLERNRMVAVVGVSGCGKSSLVKARLIPALERGGVWEAGRRWRRIVTQPAGAPFERLRQALEGAGMDGAGLRHSSQALTRISRQLPSDESLLVVVDQFEELFRYKSLAPATDQAKRSREQQAADAAEFVRLLLEASRQYPPVYVVITMRSDYLGDCAEFRDLPETLNECQYLVPRMTRQQRQEAIELPLGRVGIETSLVQRLLNDAGDEPDQLPVLQHCLMRTWNRWRFADPEQQRRLTVDDYHAIGGFDGGLNQHAEELLHDLPRDLVMRIFRRLTARGRDQRERRDPATLQHLWDVCGARTDGQRRQVTDVIERFRGGGATFLSPREGTLTPETFIDITHESLIRLWKTLRDEWLPAEELSVRMLLSVAERARNWKDGVGEVMRGRDLEHVREWNGRRNRNAAWALHYVDEPTLENVEDFIAESEARDARQRRNRRIALWGTAVVLVALAAGALSWYLDLQREVFERAQREAEAQAQSLEGTAQQALSAADVSTAELQRLQSTLAVRNTPPAPGAGASTLRPRVYIQVRSREQADSLEVLKARLEEARLVVPPVQVLNTGPSGNELRFFRRDEESEAERALAAVQQAGLSVRLVYVSGFEESTAIRRNHFELWLAPADALAALVRQLDDSNEEIRKAAAGHLARDHRSNPDAIRLVLDTLSEAKLPALTATGRLNALLFLNRSDLGAWDEEHKALAREAIARIRRRAGQGVAVGAQTENELRELEKRLSPRSAP